MIHNFVTRQSTLNDISNPFADKYVDEDFTNDSRNITIKIGVIESHLQETSTKELTAESLSTDEDSSISLTDDEEESYDDDDEFLSFPTTAIPQEIFCVSETSLEWIHHLISLRNLCFVPCNHCGNDVLSKNQPKRCPNCHVTYYCSDLCQSADLILTDHMSAYKCQALRQNKSKVLLEKLQFRRFPSNLFECLTNINESK